MPLPRGNRKHNLQKIYSMHREILRQYYVGHGINEIAKSMGLSRQTISYTVNNPLAQELINDMDVKLDMTVSKRIEELAPSALDVIESVMSNEDEPSKLRANLACNLLDRAGFGAVKKIEGSIAHGLFTPQDIEELKTRLHSSRTIEIPAEVIGESNEQTQVA